MILTAQSIGCSFESRAEACWWCASKVLRARFFIHAGAMREYATNDKNYVKKRKERRHDTQTTPRARIDTCTDWKNTQGRNLNAPDTETKMNAVSKNLQKVYQTSAASAFVSNNCTQRFLKKQSIERNEALSQEVEVRIACAKNILKEPFQSKSTRI